MAEERIGEKIYPPTPRRIEEARKRGTVAKSAYLNTMIILLASLLALKFLFPFIYEKLIFIFHNFFALLKTADETKLVDLTIQLIYTLAVTILPFTIIIFLVAVTINLAQVGINFTLSPLEPKFERIDFFEGINRLFSQRNVVRLLLGSLKLFILFCLLCYFIYLERYHIVGIYKATPSEIGGYMLNIGYKSGLYSVLVIFVLALVDFIYQRWKYLEDLKMSRSEFLEELKRYEGDPLMRERRKSFHRQILIQKMLKKVPQATAVVTNPIHIAVAIQFNFDVMKAPKVIAKGKGYLAYRIKKIAMEHGIPIFERPVLAHLLYKVDLDQEIPEELYRAVIEILKFVYRDNPKLLYSR